MRDLPKCYLLHTDPSEFKESGKTRQATCFPLSTLNHWNFTEHTSWFSKPRLPKFPRWDSWAWIMSQKMRWCAMNLNHGLWHLFVWIWALLGFTRDFSKIHDNVDMVRVANEMKPCGVKNLSPTMTIFFIEWFFQYHIRVLYITYIVVQITPTLEKIWLMKLLIIKSKLQLNLMF